MISLAPMEGITDPIVRELWSQVGGFDFVVTEFLRVTGQIVPEHVIREHCPEVDSGGRTKNGTPVFLQLLGSDKFTVPETAHRAIEMGAYGIDLNFGCPAKTVNRHDGGAVLLKTPERINEIVAAVRAAVPSSHPVSAKVRLGFDHKHFVKDIAQAAESGGAKHLTIHARTRNEAYMPPAHWEYIAVMKDCVQIPVLANGDIWNLTDWKKCASVSDCNHFALGRGAMANPFLAMMIKKNQTEKETDLDSELHWHLQVHELMENFIAANLKANNLKSNNGTIGRLKQWLRLLSHSSDHFKLAFEIAKVESDLSTIQRQLNNLLRLFN